MMTIPDSLQVEALLLIIAKRDRQIEAYRYAANEWADVATNAKPWLETLESELNDPNGPKRTKEIIEQAKKNMDDGVKHCQQVSERARNTE